MTIPAFEQRQGGSLCSRHVRATSCSAAGISASVSFVASGSVTTVETERNGARFANDIACMDQQERDFRTVLAALQRPAPPQAVGDMIDVFRATGTRKPQGSPTDFNAQIEWRSAARGCRSRC